uniref:Large ribosomal subunit protein mL42 n=1 Tax=Meloidogyne javanica TaxID=6303 RepID=A0A915LDM8_MELJA
MSNPASKLWQTVVCKNGVVAAWHPSIPFPYGHSRPIDLTQIEEQKKKFLQNIQKYKDSTEPIKEKGPSDLELREIFYTNMQEWRPRYRETRLRIQEYLFQQICLKQKPNQHYLCMFEHSPPAYIVGIREGIYTEETEQKVVKLGAEFHRVKRGGLITFHGPGQLVAYPVKYF